VCCHETDMLKSLELTVLHKILVNNNVHQDAPPPTPSHRHIRV